MAKIVKLLDESGVITYPATITSAIVDLTLGKDLSTLVSAFSGILLVKDSTLKYHLLDGAGTKLGVDIDIAQDTFLDSVTFTKNYSNGTETYPALHFVFNSASGKSDIYVRVADLVDVYTADETTLTVNNNQFSVKSGVFASSSQGSKADSALLSISKGTDGNYVTTTVSTKSGNSQTVGVLLTVLSISSAGSENMGVAEASDVKEYIDSLISSTAAGAQYAAGDNNSITVDGTKYTLTVDNSTKEISLEPYTPIGISLSSGVTYEIDSNPTLSRTVTATVTGTNKATATVTWKIGSETIGTTTGASTTQTHTFTKNTNSTISATATDGSSSKSASSAVTWSPAVMWGWSTSGDLTSIDSTISGYGSTLQSSAAITNKSIATGAAGYLYFAAPALANSLYISNTTSKASLAGGWQYIGTFSKYTTNRTYYLYRTEAKQAQDTYRIDVE